MRNTMWLGLMCMVMALAVAVPCTAGQEASTVTPPEANAVLGAMMKHYNALPGASVTVVSRSAAEVGAEAEGLAFRTLLARPNLFSSRQDGSGPNRGVVVCDGSTLSMAITGFKVYSSKPAPANMAALLDATCLDMKLTPIQLLSIPSTLTMTLMEGERLAALIEALPERVSLGREQVDGVPCERLRLKGPDGQANLWVQAEGDPWLHKVTTRTSDRNQMAVVAAEVCLKDWRLRDDLKPADFVFTVPNAAKKVETLTRWTEELDEVRWLDDAEGTEEWKPPQ